MSRQQFRGWIIVSFVLMVAWVVSDMVTVGQLPEDLRAFHEAEPELTPILLTGAFLAISVMVLYLIAFIGLFIFWRPARVLYLIATIGGFLVPFFIGPTVSTALTNGFSYIDCAVSGFILALVYYSPIKQYFERPSSAAPE